MDRRNLLIGLGSLGAGVSLTRACSAATVGEGKAVDEEGLVVTARAFGWTEASSPDDTCRAINAALQSAAEKGCKYVENSPKKIAGTITIPKGSVIEFAPTAEWIAIFDKPQLFTSLQEYKDAKAAPSGKRIFVDTASGTGTVFRGTFQLTAARLSSMRLAERKKIPDWLVAMSASRPAEGGVGSEEITIERMIVGGFGHVLYQGDQRGGRSILPYTRMQVANAYFRFNLQTIVSGAAGNGLDDAQFQILRMSRNGGDSIIRGTDLNVSSMFHFGLHAKRDIEPDEVALTAGNSAVLIPNGAGDLRVGDVLAFVTGGQNLDGESIPFVSEIVGINGNRVRLADAPSQSGTSGYVVNPPGIVLAQSSMNTMHLYFEGLHYMPVTLANKARLSCMDFKVSGGQCGCKAGCVVHVQTGLSSVDLALNTRSVANGRTRAMIGIPMSGEDGICSAVGGRIVAAGGFEESYAKNNLVMAYDASAVKGRGACTAVNATKRAAITAQFSDGSFGITVGKDGKVAVSKLLSLT